MKEDWLKDIHDKMADYEVDEPLGLWDDIRQSGLPSMKTTSSKPTPIRVKMWFKRVSAVAAMLALLISAGYLWRHNEQAPAVSPISQVELGVEANPQTSETAVPASGVDSSSISILRTPQDHLIAAVTQANRHAVTADLGVLSDVLVQNRAMVEVDAETPVIAQVQDKAEVQDESQAEGLQSDESQDEMQSPSQTSDPVASKRQPLHRYNSGMQHRDHLAQAKTQKTSRFTFGVYTGGNGLPSFDSGSSGDLANEPLAMAEPVYGDPTEVGQPVYNINWRDDPKLAIMVYNQGKQVYVDYDHHLPIRAGISFAYRFNQRVSLESGVTYTHLTSDIREGSTFYYVTGKQSLDYIGIPLNLKYILYSWKGLDLYASMGVLGEQSVTGRLEKNYVFNGTVGMSETEDLDEKPFQWSFNASGGVQYNFTPVVGIYAEPGVSYFPDDGTKIETIYKEKPFNFNLNFGIRFNFGK